MSFFTAFVRMLAGHERKLQVSAESVNLKTGRWKNLRIFWTAQVTSCPDLGYGGGLLGWLGGGVAAGFSSGTNAWLKISLSVLIGAKGRMKTFEMT